MCNEIDSLEPHLYFSCSAFCGGANEEQVTQKVGTRTGECRNLKRLHHLPEHDQDIFQVLLTFKELITVIFKEGGAAGVTVYIISS